ncbi:hypothetical protein ScPMuIL_018123 [Solemya velum]
MGLEAVCRVEVSILWTTVGTALAALLHWQYRDADEFHTTENKEKMSQGIPLTDQDRYPWLLAIHGFIQSSLYGGKSVIVSCSALKKTYRDILQFGSIQDCSVTPGSPDKSVILSSDEQAMHNTSFATNSNTSENTDIMFVLLKGSEETIRTRMESRHGHFMPLSLLQSQLETLEEPCPPENFITVDINNSKELIVDDIISKLSIRIGP